MPSLPPVASRPFVPLILLGMCIAPSEAYPTLTRTPAFSFDTLGHATFAHVTKSSPFNATELAFLSKFPIVQFDKGQNAATMPGAAVEDRFIAAAKQIKEVNPEAFTLFYQNLLIAFDIFQRVVNVTRQSPHDYYVTNSKGEFSITLPPYDTFDHTKPAMRQLFVNDCIYGIHSGYFDGCFIDRANWAESVRLSDNSSIPGHNWDVQATNTAINGSHMALEALMAAVGEDHVILAKETSHDTPAQDWQRVNAMMVTDTFCSQYTRPGKPAPPYDRVQCRRDIDTVINASSRGQLTESHGQGHLNDTTARHFTMACFLVAHGNLSYFSYASSDPGLAWSLAGTRWWPEYDYPLGVPQGPAQISADGWIYQRRFASGTEVTVDVFHGNATINWGEMPRTDGIGM